MRSAVAAVSPNGHVRVAKVCTSRLARGDAERVGIDGVVGEGGLARDQGSRIATLPSGRVGCGGLRRAVDGGGRIVELDIVRGSASQVGVPRARNSALGIRKHLTARERVVTITLVTVHCTGETVTELVAVRLAHFGRELGVGKAVRGKRQFASTLRETPLVSPDADRAVSRCRVRIVCQVECIEVVVVSTRFGCVALAC